jgi:hypothetical protein
VTNVLKEFPIALTAVLDMSHANDEHRSSDEPYGTVQVRIHVGDQDFRGPTLSVTSRPEWVEGREEEVVAGVVAQWMLDLAEKGHSHVVR